MIKRIMKKVNIIEEYLLAIFLTGILVTIFIQVIFRSLLNNPLTWTEELAKILFIWLNLIGTSMAIRKKVHVSLDFFVNYFPEKFKLILSIAINVLIACFLIYIFQPTIRYIGFINSIPSAALGWPMGIFYLGIPISTISIILSLIIDTQDLLKELKDGGEITCQ